MRDRDTLICQSCTSTRFTTCKSLLSWIILEGQLKLTKPSDYYTLLFFSVGTNKNEKAYIDNAGQ